MPAIVKSLITYVANVTYNEIHPSSHEHHKVSYSVPLVRVLALVTVRETLCDVYTKRQESHIWYISSLAKPRPLGRKSNDMEVLCGLDLGQTREISISGHGAWKD